MRARTPVLALLAGIRDPGRGASARRVRRRCRARRAMERRLRLVVRLHLGDAGALGAAHRDRSRYRALVPGRRVQHRRRGPVLCGSDRGDVGGTSPRRPAAGRCDPVDAGRCRPRRRRVDSGTHRAQDPVRRGGSDQHASAQFRRGIAGQPDGAGAAAGIPAHLSSERSDRRLRPAPLASRNAAARGILARNRRRRDAPVSVQPHTLGIPAPRRGNGAQGRRHEWAHTRERRDRRPRCSCRG